MKIKSLFFQLSLFFFPLSMIGQSFPVNPETNRIEYDEVVQVDETTVDVLFQRSKLFYKYEFKTENFDFNDTVEHIVKNDGGFILSLEVLGMQVDYNIIYTLTIKSKDNRYKYTLDNFRLTTSESGGDIEVSLISYYKKPNKKIKTAVEQTLEKETSRIIADLKSTMQTGNKISEDDDW